MHAPTHVALAAVESFFGAGVVVSPMEGANIFRYLPALQDDWAGGLHVEVEPDKDDVDQWLSSWKAFEAPGRLRWVAGVDHVVDPGIAIAVESAGFEVVTRPVFEGVPPRVTMPMGVKVVPIGDDPKAWAGFEVMARWIDPNTSPDTWRWRATRVRHMVEGGRGQAWIARSSIAPVAAMVRLRAPSHRQGAPNTVGVVVHEAHRGRSIAQALLCAATPSEERVSVLGRRGRVLGAATSLGLTQICTLVEVRRPGTHVSKG